MAVVDARRQHAYAGTRTAANRTRDGEKEEDGSEGDPVVLRAGRAAGGVVLRIVACAEDQKHVHCEG